MVHAQKKTSGAIQFETTTDPAAAMAASGIQVSEQMQARMPSSSKTPYELLFNATNASYMPVEEIEDSNGGGNRGFGGRMMRFGGMNRDYYYTFADQKVVGVFDLTDTTFYMPASLKLDLTPPMAQMRPANPNPNPNNTNANSNGNPRRIASPPVVEVIKTDNVKKIIGIDCKEVIIKSTRKLNFLGEDREVVEETHLWYTNDLGFNFSPNPNLWTEGAVLAIESKGNTTVAKSIEYRNVSAKDVTAPKKAKLLSSEEYAAKMEAMARMFRNMRPGGPGGPGMGPRNN